MDDIQTLIDKHQSILATTPMLMKMISSAQDDIKDESWREMQNIRVITRFRPPNQVEIDQNIEDLPPKIDGKRVTLTQITNDKTNTQKETRTQFESVLDLIFNTDSTQKQIFCKVGQPLIEASLGGFNATLFAYGQTGSGKTYSTFGANDDGSGSDPQSMGVIPRSFAYIFERLDHKCNNGSITDYTVSIQLLQIYNKQLLDLLNPDTRIKLKIKTDFENDDSVYVQHLTKIEITSARQALACIIEGSKNRITASHKLNAHSSRSHMLVLLKVKQRKEDGSSINSNVNFGDLAGSENISKAHGKTDKGMDEDEINIANERRKEGIAINSSLSALTRCIHLLVKGRNPTYRESPLTHLLQDSLGGNSKTTLLVCASPHIYNRSETISTLRFAATAKAVKNKAKINMNLSVKALRKRIKELEAENKRLKKRLKGKKKKAKEPFQSALGKRLSSMWIGTEKKERVQNKDKKKLRDRKLKEKRMGVKETKDKGKYKKKVKNKYKRNGNRISVEDGKYVEENEDEDEDDDDDENEEEIEENKSYWAQMFYCYFCGNNDDDVEDDIDEELNRRDSEESSLSLVTEDGND